LESAIRQRLFSGGEAFSFPVRKYVPPLPVGDAIFVNRRVCWCEFYPSANFSWEDKGGSSPPLWPFSHQAGRSLFSVKVLVAPGFPPPPGDTPLKKLGMGHFVPLPLLMPTPRLPDIPSALPPQLPFPLDSGRLSRSMHALRYGPWLCRAFS